MMKCTGLIVLVLIAGMTPAFGGKVTIFEGTDGVSSYATASGGSINEYTTSGYMYATLREGLEGHVLIPEGLQGNAWSRWHASESSLVAPSLNYDSFQLSASYSGDLNVGARKTTDSGVASADAVIVAAAEVDNSFSETIPYAEVKKRYLSGNAEISSDTSNTGDGTTYAHVNGTAKYGVMELSSLQAKEIRGSVKGYAYIESVNSECAACPDCPACSASGGVGLYTVSNADDWTSYANSALFTSICSDRGDNPGTTEIDGYSKGSAESMAWDGMAPGTMVKDLSNANVYTAAGGGLKSSALTYARGDYASAETILRSESWHNLQNGNLDYNKASGSMTSSAAVRRVDMNTPKPADAINTVSYTDPLSPSSSGSGGVTQKRAPRSRPGSVKSLNSQTSSLASINAYISSDSSTSSAVLSARSAPSSQASRRYPKNNPKQNPAPAPSNSRVTFFKAYSRDNGDTSTYASISIKSIDMRTNAHLVNVDDIGSYLSLDLSGLRNRDKRTAKILNSASNNGPDETGLKTDCSEAYEELSGIETSAGTTSTDRVWANVASSSVSSKIYGSEAIGTGTSKISSASFDTCSTHSERTILSSGHNFWAIDYQSKATN